MSQNTQILNHLQQGKSITLLEALRIFDSLRLAARINDLKDKGHNIITTMMKANGKTFASYKLVKGK